MHRGHTSLLIDRERRNGKEENTIFCPLVIASQGKGPKKRFIPKGEGQQYFLLHRSQTDTAHLGESAPSNFVLVQADEVVIFFISSKIAHFLSRSLILETLTISIQTLLPS
jgi:hypothetical protein